MEKIWLKIHLGKLVVPYIRIATIKQGEKAAPWYYGLAYEDFYRDASIWYPIPINYIIRFSMMLKCKWDMHRGKPSWVDKQVNLRWNEVSRELINEKRDTERVIHCVNKLMTYVLAEKEKLQLAKDIINSKEVSFNEQ